MSLEINKDQFPDAVLKASFTRPVLVDFWATWCQPCRMLAPILDKLVQDADGALELVKVDTDREQELALHFGIRSLPTVMLFVDGKVATQFSGVLPPEAIRRMLDPYLPRASDSVTDEVASLVAAGRLAEACALLRGAIESDAENFRLHAQLADLLLQDGKLDETEELLRQLPPNVAGDEEFVRLQAKANFTRIGSKAPTREALEQAVQADPDDLESRYQLSARQVMSGDYDAALDNLLHIIRTERGFRDDAGRKAMVEVFTLLNNDGPLVRRYRGLLSSALN